MPEAAILPELEYADIGEAIDWLSQALGFRERWRVGQHRAQMTFGNGAIVVREPQYETPRPGSITMRVPDVDGLSAQAMACGARLRHPPTNYPYGERQCSIEDPGGHIWNLSESIIDVAPEEWGAISAGV